MESTSEDGMDAEPYRGAMRVFLYGTLLPGHRAWSLIEPYVVRVAWKQQVAGQLYDTGRGYPAAVFAAERRDRDARVHGCCVEVDPARAVDALARLDEFEGAEYARVTVAVLDGDDATAYEWIAPVDGFVALSDGIWRGDERGW